MFEKAKNFNGDLSSWNVSSGTDFSQMFNGASKFNSDLSNWNVGNGTNFSYMFAGTTIFNSDLSNWDVSKGINFNSMFNGARAFTSDLSNWDVSKGTNFTSMFSDARVFTSDLSNWNVGNGTIFASMFMNAYEFNSDLSNWDVSKSTNFLQMFRDTRKFNSDLSKWDVSKGTNFGSMFYNAYLFTSDLSKWDVSKGTNFNNMFYGARTFTSDLSGWNVSKGSDFSNMFSGARLFNSDLSNWDVSLGKNFTNMFYNATAFNSDLSRWNLNSITPANLALNYFLRGSGINCNNLSNTLIGWANNPLTRTDIASLDLTGLKYSAGAAATLTTLQNQYNWSGITTGAIAPDGECYPVPLPIRLISFNAYGTENDKVIINREIIEDESVKSYTIERSTPYNSWVEIKELAPKLDLSTTQVYQYIDIQPAKGTNLYRLKITDAIYDVKYSYIATVTLNKKNNILLYPNPATSVVNLASSNETIKALSLYNTKGQLILEALVEATQHSLDLNNLPLGVYFLKVTQKDGSTIMERIIKQ